MIVALAQGDQGFLWLGTARGLYRFDGVQFERYQPSSGGSLLSDNIVSLYHDPSGGLWVGYGEGGAGYLKDGQIKNYTEADGLPNGAAMRFLRDLHGTLWTATVGGLARFVNRHWEKLGTEWKIACPCVSLFAGTNGALWVGTERELYRLNDGAKQFEKKADHLFRAASMAMQQDGTLWLAETGRSVHPVNDTNTEAVVKAGIKVGSRAILFDDEGSFWIATAGDGVRRVPHPELFKGESISEFSDEAETFTQANGLSSDDISSILQDREGSIWVGTSRGLDRFRQSSIVPVSLPTGKFGLSVTPGGRGTIWVGSRAGGLFHVRDGRVVKVLSSDVASTAVYLDRNGALWQASATGLIRNVNGNSTTIAIPGGALGNALTGSKDGSLWLATSERSVLRLKANKWSRLQDIGGPSGVAGLVYTDASDRVWCGFHDNLVALIDNEHVKTYSSRNGVAIGDVKTIDSVGSNVWIGGDVGIEYLNGDQFRTMRPADGPSFTAVNSIVATIDHGVWFSESRGLVHVDENEISKLLSDPTYRVKFQILDSLDGAPDLSMNFASASTKGTNGVLWFATVDGLVWIDPSRTLRNSLPPSVFVRTVVANGNEFKPEDNLQLPSRINTLRISYTAPSLVVPERVHFRYFLEGEDKVWQDAGTRREAAYSSLAPGRYRFHVIACNNDGVWNTTGSAINIVIAPTFYETAWFYLLIALAVLGFLWLMYLVRVRLLTAQIQKRLVVQVEERDRIAREIHDTLLQSIQGLTLRFHVAVASIPEHLPARGVLEGAMDRADAIIVEGRNRIQALRQKTKTSEELPAHLAKRGADLSEIHPIKFDLSVSGTEEAINVTVCDELRAIGEEALANAFHHAGASRIEVAITYNSRGVQLVIRDDGRGIDQATLSNGKFGHWGLVGMRERATKIGAEMKIWSRKGAGTELEIFVPAQIASHEVGATTQKSFWRRIR